MGNSLQKMHLLESFFVFFDSFFVFNIFIEELKFC